MDLRKKNILITAGPTWVAIDDVRVLSNVASGETGILLAKKLTRLGARVSLLLGPVGACCLDKKIRLINFRFYSELKNRLKLQLRSRRYDIIIHNAAVSDFSASRRKGKISSGSAVSLRLRPLPKIAKDLKYLAPQAKLVIFKLEPAVSDKILLRRAIAAGKNTGADIVVANRISPYRAFIIGRAGKIIAAKSKAALAGNLVDFFKFNL